MTETVVSRTVCDIVLRILRLRRLAVGAMAEAW